MGIHIATAWFLSTYSVNWVVFTIITYVIGATCTHALFLAIHEISHNLAAKSHMANTALGMFANLPIVLPYSVPFKYYHMLHHADMGRIDNDSDLPTQAEARCFKGKLGKSIWVMMQIGFYAFRPMVVKMFPPSPALVCNWIVQLTFDYIIYTHMGFTPFIYWGISAVFAGSVHPVAGHFISEHYTFKEGQETYSYYGPLNWLAFNVGYHNEHHDFLTIPGSRLPQLYKMAPEFYDNLEKTDSWPMTIINYILMDNMSGWSRIKRPSEKED